MSYRIPSATTRKRGRGTTPEERKRSRAAFRAWDTRRESARRSKRSAAARKAARTRKKSTN